MAFLELKGVSKSYGTGAARSNVLTDINLEVAEGEFIAILGFSGSGKTTLLSAIAGLVTPDTGTVTLKGKAITGPGPERGVVFQSYSLMPWLTVEGNIELAVNAVFSREGKEERAERVTKAIAMVGLSHARDRRPEELSGGMRQRVSVARALAMSPEILLLDEPLSALDALTRAKLQNEIEQIWRHEKKTVVLITNDVDEALLLADRVIPLTPGPGATLGPSFEVDLERPRNRTALNHDTTYKKLRADITKTLIASGINRGSQGRGVGQDKLPAIAPISWMKTLPKAYRDAAKPRAPDRYLEFFELRKVYPTPKGPLTVVEDFNLIMRKGEFISLIGHSGCGKSTVLSMTAGLNSITSGGIVLDGQEVTGAGPDRAVVFQAPSLMPWLTARENVALGVDRVYPHARKNERADIVDYYLTRVGLGDAMDKRAADMSNGMRQRVGIARAFSLSPKLLLLDEPFGMLDSLTRWELQEVLMDVWKRTQVTAICVTHDVDEAILLADRVIMMTNGPHATIGRMVEIDIPRPRTRQELLRHPRYYEYRESILNFLEEFEHGATPAPDAQGKSKPDKSLEDAA
ncbi:ATPase components of various ABC-type transport system protein [Candidatus Filomicrobium marinum]|uniref:ATPase components of various ABC-type transport system protein n=1 Tax=Candidatus Filomicrobium marinum TaxID=1608628 RepID=A0A0D6JEA8_9HYPH|nr:nitrate ABC transporter ATP-binding protein [Candidatus Filomicrobium marinum]CFX15228.1 ATPase components of various ABC-type transport system protein [Candidatus Filomicrobium marinum]CPR17922.1 ATPase components of various ABC-type transport system protein [Candidatus Filomicrobium marinum]